MISIHPGLINFKRPSEHSTYSPSSMDRLIACPASIKICANIPQEPEADYATEGTLAHSHAEASFYLEMYGAPISLDLQHQVAAAKSCHEMLSGSDMYVKEIRDWLGNPEVGRVLWYGLERGVPIFPEKGAFGTGDCIIVGSKAAVVIDYKFGKKKVHADSKQLKAYAAGVLRYLQDVPEDYRIYTVIVQPRVDVAAAVHCYSLEEIREFLAIIADMIVQSEKPNLLPNRGDKKHCFWCPASRTSDPRLKCPALRSELTTLAETDLRGYLRQLSEPIGSLSEENFKRDEALKKLIALAPAVNQAAQKAREEFEFRIQSGEKIPGVEFISTEGKRKWAHSDDAIMWSELAKSFPELQNELVKNIPASVKLKTLSEIEKMVGKEKLNGLTIKTIIKTIELTDDEQTKHANLFIDYETTNHEE